MSLPTSQFIPPQLLMFLTYMVTDEEFREVFKVSFDLN